MRTRSPRVARVLAIFGLVTLPLMAAVHQASGATVIPLTLEGMEHRATAVFVGTVESTKAGWDQGHRIIETRVRIRVEQRVKGAGGRMATVVVPGGIVGDIGMRRPGAAVFKNGERVLLLAGPRRPGELRPVGLFQGKLRIRHDDARGIDVVEAPGPAWGARGKPIAAGTISKGRTPALPLSQVLGRLGVSP